ncbi:pyrin-like [Ochotona curzoniae]|uniref:pyrin-like n=1 Tax=Ochotona curzoniae TaxID=130825 RepID=UPI001B34E15C|nr:pyrin-like [Ochotona curzoniae]
MARTLSDHLLNTLEDLVPYDLEKFKFKLQNISLEKEHSRIPRGQLQMARPVELATLLVTYYGKEYAVRLTLQVLRAINQRLLAEELHRVTGPEPAESSWEGPEAPSSAVKTAWNLKVAAGPDSKGEPQGGDSTPSLLASQPEAGRGSQKKPQGKRRDPKCPSLDAQGKLLGRRSPGLCKPSGGRPAEVSAQLRRNVSSAGRLQGHYGVQLARKEQRKADLYLDSGKKRPKSLEFTISSEDKEASKPGSLLAGEEIGAGNTTRMNARNPEQSTVPQRGPFRNTPPSALVTTEEESTAPWGEKGIEGTETPDTQGAAAEDALCQASDPDVQLFSGKPQGKAACSLCHTQKGDPVGGICRHGVCSCPLVPGHLRASSNHLHGCLQRQASLAWKNSPELSSQPLPQCQRHMKQVQLLFCEDHREPICLICRLSQEHQGHRVRPLEEVALEYREQIQQQLERLKQLRQSGEQQGSQGAEQMESLLKQTEIQKQRIRSQVEQLFKFLERQEQLFVAWLDELGQTIGQVREKYGTQVSCDIALLDELTGELEAQQCQPEWELVQGIGVTLHRAKAMTAPEPWVTPPEVREKIHLLYQKSEFIEKSMKHFSETLRLEMETFNVPELIGAQAYAVNIILDTKTSHPNLIFSDNLKSMRLGNKWDQLPEGSERFDSCIIALGTPSFLSGRHYWEVEVRDKTTWMLGVCKASVSRKGSMTLSPENGYWVMMMKQNEYQVSSFPPTRLKMREPPRRVGIFLDYMTRNISFYNVTARSHIYTFTSFSSSGPLQAIFSPGGHDGGKNTGPLTICPANGQRPH